MPLRRGKPLAFRPGTLTDSVDGTNSPAGSMAALINLVPDPSTAGVYVPRPAATIASIRGGFVSGELVVGDIVYGMEASKAFPGFDQPYAYNLLTGTPIAIDGVTSANIPASAPVSGPWQPPILCAIGGRIIVCHPGFPGGTIKFGWFDVSGFSEVTTGNTNSSVIIDGNPDVLGLMPGMVMHGQDIAVGARVVSTTLYVNKTTGDIASGTDTILNVANMVGVAVGQPVEGAGIPQNTLVTVASGTTITMSKNATATATTEAITVSGATITMDQDATDHHSNVTLTIDTGNLAIPVWGAGDTDRNNLLARPVGVAQFNGRAYFALEPDPTSGTALGMQFSDPLLPCRISNTLAVQALTPANNLPVTAVYSLMLSAPLLTGGIVQGLLAFQGATCIQQITGDPVTTDLAMNALPVQTGTLAPLSLFSCEVGTGFISPDGMRIVGFDGRVTPPIGEGGTGICLPFVNTASPSRIVAACNRSTIRISNDNGGKAGNPREEYWYDTSRKVWTGPHSFPASLIQPWRNTFVLSTFDPANFAALWQSDPVPVPTSGYVENGVVLSWTFQPSPLPDSGDVNMNALVDMTIGMQLPLGLLVTVNAADLNGFGLSQAIVPFTDTSPSFWGEFNWGRGHWGGGQSFYQQYACNFDRPLEFKQLNLTVRGQSAHDTRVGNLYMRYQQLGYKLEAA